MNIDDLTIGQAKQLAALVGGSTGSAQRRPLMPIGAKVFIRGVTMAYTGEVVACTDCEVSLRKAAWIADTGRFAQAMAGGTFSEVEPYPDDMIVHVNREAYSDWHEVTFELPRSQK
jgi:hypothetical protein